MSEPVAGKVPMRSVHLADHYGATTTRCGRVPKWTKPFHASWPLCKTCRRVLEASGKGWSFMASYDADGWAMPASPYLLTSNTGTAYTSSTTTFIRWEAA